MTNKTLEKINLLLQQYFTVEGEEEDGDVFDISVFIEDGELVVKEACSFTTSDGGVMCLYRPISGPAYRLSRVLESALEKRMGEEWFQDLKSFLIEHNVWDYALPNIEC